MEKADVLRKLGNLGPLNQKDLAELIGVTDTVIKTMRRNGLINPARGYGIQTGFGGPCSFSPQEALRAGAVISLREAKIKGVNKPVIEDILLRPRGIEGQWEIIGPFWEKRLKKLEGK